MGTVKIDNVEYDAEQLSGEAKNLLASIKFCDQELKRLQAQAAALQTARQVYAKELKATLNPAAHMGEKLSFG